MKMKWVMFLLGTIFVQAQLDSEPVVWETHIEKTEDNRIILFFEASIAPKWHLYSQFSSKDGALPTEFVFNPRGYERIGNVEESTSVTEYDNVFEMDLTYFNDRATFQQELFISDSSLSTISVEVNYQACDDKLCIFRSEIFRFSLDGNDVASTLVTDETSQRLSSELKLELLNTDLLENTLSEEITNSFSNIFLLGFNLYIVLY